MGVSREEVQAKLSLDTTVLGRARREIAEFSEHGHLGFLHASNGAKEFHKAIHQLSEEVPALGLGIKALLSPIGAAIGGATLAFGFFNKKLEEVNKEMDEIGKRNAEASGLTVEGIRRINTEAETSQSKFRAWVAGLHRVREEETKTLDHLLASNERLFQSESRRNALGRDLSIAKAGLGVMTGSLPSGMLQDALIQAQRTFESNQRSAEEARLQGDVSASEAALGDVRLGTGARGRAGAAEKRLHSTQMLLQQDHAHLEAAQKRFETETNAKPEDFKDVSPLGLDASASGGGSKLARIAKTLFAAGGGFAGAQWFMGQKALREQNEQDRLDETHAERLRRLNRTIQDANKIINERSEAEGAAKEQVAELNGEVHNFEDRTKKAKEALKAFQSSPASPGGAQAASSPFIFSMAQLAGYNTRYGAVAREIQRRTGIAQYYTAAGYPELAQQTLKSIYGEDVTSQGFDFSKRERLPSGVLYPKRINIPSHIPGLIDLLPKGLTQEQNELQRTKELIDSITKALVPPGEKGVPVALVDNKL